MITVHNQGPIEQPELFPMPKGNETVTSLHFVSQVGFSIFDPWLKDFLGTVRMVEEIERG